MPLPPDLAALIVSGNVSFMGQRVVLSVMSTAPTANEIGITFGEYPALAQSSFSMSASISEALIKPIPQPDVEPFGPTAEIKSISMAVVAAYVEHDIRDPEQFGASATIKSITMAPVEVEEPTLHEIHDPEQFCASADIKSISMAVVAAYAEHEIHDREQFGASATIKSITMNAV